MMNRLLAIALFFLRGAICFERFLQGSSLECNLTYCHSESKGEKNPICCSESFNCLTEESKDLCVYSNSSVVKNSNFCLTQAHSCYYCCFNNTCNNRKACENHFADFRQDAFLIFVFVVCLFMVAIITFTIFAAIRQIRLNKVSELKKKHKILSNNTISNINTSKNEGEEEADYTIPSADLSKKLIARKQ